MQTEIIIIIQRYKLLGTWKISFWNVQPQVNDVQLARAVEYTDCFSAEG